MLSQRGEAEPQRGQSRDWGVTTPSCPGAAVLGDIDAEAKLSATADVEAQAVVIRGGVEVDDAPQPVLRAAL